MQTVGMQKITDDFYVDKSKTLGKGNFGVVFKGYWVSENKIIAVKFMSSPMLQKFPDYKRQIIVMDDLSKLHHPNIMGYYGSELNKDGLYCFIEFCNGGSLKDIIKDKISQLKVMVLLKQLLQAMTYINKVNKVHRDLKPDNILLDENQQLKIADFGLARDVQIQMTKGACTPLYAAPQVINLKPYNQKCDMWSAGLILYQMLTGNQFFAHVKTKKHLLAQIQKFNTGQAKLNYPKSLHSQWDKITMSMLTYNPAKRPSFQQMLKSFQKGYEAMYKQLSAKYGYEMPGFEDFDDGLRLTKTISPYQSKPPNKDTKQTMLKKLMEQRSFTNINKLRKYLLFFRHKNELLNRLIKQFTNNTYSCLKNVYKYMLMYLSVATFISRQIQHVQDLKSCKIGTPDGLLTQNDFEQTHINQVKTLIKDYINKHQNSMSKFRAVLQKQISAKIKGYMGRQQQKKILSQNRLPQLIQKSNMGQFEREDIYLLKYMTIMNTSNVYLTEQALETLGEGDVKVYFHVRLIGSIDKYFVDANYKSDDYVHMKKQQIQNMNKHERILNIAPFNKK